MTKAKDKTQMSKLPDSMTEYDSLVVWPDKCEINKFNIGKDEYDYIYRWIYRKFLSMSECPFCSTHFLTAEYKRQECHDLSHCKSVIQTFNYLRSCPNCAYWDWSNRDFIERMPPGSTNTQENISETLMMSKFCISKMREFDVTLPEGCEKELALAIRRNNRIWHTIDPYKFERFVSSVFKANFADCEVMHVGKSDDGGVDIIFIDSEKHHWLIQVKRRESPDASEGVGTVRNLLGALILNRSLQGIIVSTADHFTFRAHEATARAKKVGWIVELIDRGKLNHMLNPLLPDRPWLSVIAETDSKTYKEIKKQIPRMTRRHKIF
jgi:Restriction endonuclease